MHFLLLDTVSGALQIGAGLGLMQGLPLLLHHAVLYYLHLHIIIVEVALLERNLLGVGRRLLASICCPYEL